VTVFGGTLNHHKHTALIFLDYRQSSTGGLQQRG
jgi:hypothetical protein